METHQMIKFKKFTKEEQDPLLADENPVTENGQDSLQEASLRKKIAKRGAAETALKKMGGDDAEMAAFLVSQGDMKELDKFIKTVKGSGRSKIQAILDKHLKEEVEQVDEAGYKVPKNYASMMAKKRRKAGTSEFGRHPDKKKSFSDMTPDEIRRLPKNKKPLGAQMREALDEATSQKLMNKMKELSGGELPRKSVELRKLKAKAQDELRKATAAKKAAPKEKTTTKTAKGKTHTGSADPADKNIIMQLRKAQDLDGKMDIRVSPAGRTVKLPKAQIDKLLKKHDSLGKPRDKRVFTTNLIRALRKSGKMNEQLDEGAVISTTVRKEIMKNGGTNVGQTAKEIYFTMKGKKHSVPLYKNFVSDKDYMKLQDILNEEVNLDENKLLKVNKLSSFEYQKAKKLKGFDKSKYTWDSKQQLYVKEEVELDEVTSPEIKAAYADAMKTKPRSAERKAAIQKYQKLRLQAIDAKKTKKEEVELEEKAVSQAQQKMMGMALAYKRGEMDDASPEVKKMADSMSEKDLEDFASTKHKGLPMKKEALDPVGKADADIDNDGDVDKSDKYLKNRRKAIAKALRKEEVEQVDEKTGRWIIGKSDKGFSYLDKKRKQRQDQHMKQDPKTAKAGYARNIVDTDKAKKKAAKKGVTPRVMSWRDRNSAKKGRLPEETQMDEGNPNLDQHPEVKKRFNAIKRTKPDSFERKRAVRAWSNKRKELMNNEALDPVGKADAERKEDK